nr:reverse transcriptase domain-containing protein [Tanacetum cinerariifolium]
MANTTPIVTTVTKPATNPRDADATPRVNIQDFCEEYYEDILPFIMNKVRRDKRKEVHARLDFGEGSRERRTREGSYYSSARTLSARPERLKVRDRLRYNDRHVLDRLGHRRQSAFDRLSETYSPSTTKSRPGRTSSRDRSRGRSRPHRLGASNGDRPENKECFRGVGESYDNSHFSYRTGINHGYHYHDRDRSRHMKRGRDSESSLSSVSKSDSRAARVWFDELPPESIDSYKDPKAAFLAYFMQQKKYVKDPVEIHNIKQKDEETIEDFMERFKVKTGRMKGAPECMRISGFMHGVNNPELTKCLNEHVPRTMEEMMITTTTFIRREAAAASKKKCHTSWRTQDQSKRQTSKKRSDFRGQPREGRGSSSSGTKGPLVIEAKIGGHMIHRMYVDGGSSTEVLYEHCFNRLRLEVKNQMVPTTTSLTSFSGETIWPLGQLRLLVTIGDADHSTRAWMNFMIVRSLSSYNGIIGRPEIKEIQAVPSTAHGMLKFPAGGRIVTIRSTIFIPIECATMITLSKEIPKEAGVRHENFKVALHPNFPDQEPSDMTGVLRSVAEHRLNIRVGYSLVRQKKGQDPERTEAIQAEIQLEESDEEKTAFYTGQGVYCYTKMPFGLKNAGATYQRLVDKAFDNQIGRNIEVYVDDLVIKSHTEAEMLRDIDETFRTLRKINMKLNPKKCTFGAVEGMFLGYMITPEGIKPCPDKTKAVLQLPSSRKIKETSEAEQSFKQLKHHLSKLPLLVAPKPKEKLIVYMSASNGAIIAVLMTEKRMVQMLVYFISCALQGSELNYTPMEKLVLSLVFAAKRLRSVMLGEHNITYRPRTSVKGQVLADFLVEMPDENPPDASVVETQQEPWTLFTDGSSCVDGSGAGLILTSPEGTKFTYALRFQFAASNNEAEYEALIAGLRIAAQMGVQNVHVSVDCKLVANQVLGAYVTKEENMIKYLEKVKSLVIAFTNFSINQVPRSKNKKADALSKIASTSFALLSKQVLVEILKEKSIQEKEVTTVVEEDGPTRPFLTPWLRCVRPLQADYVIREIHEGSCSMHAGPRKAPAVQWTRRKSKPELRGRNQGSPGRGKQELEAVIPEEIGMSTYRTAAVDVIHNDEELRLNTDLLEERCERAAIREAKAKLKMTKCYNARVRGVTFRPGDFVYRSNDASHVVDGRKLGSKWERPYEVTEALGDRAYKLRSMDETVLPRT